MQVGSGGGSGVGLGADGRAGPDPREGPGADGSKVEHREGTGTSPAADPGVGPGAAHGLAQGECRGGRTGKLDSPPHIDLLPLVRGTTNPFGA